MFVGRVIDVGFAMMASWHVRFLVGAVFFAGWVNFSLERVFIEPKTALLLNLCQMKPIKNSTMATKPYSKVRNARLISLK